MAYEGKQIVDSFIMNDSATAKQYYVVKMSTIADTVSLTTASGERAFGINQDYSSSGGVVNVCLFGVSKVTQDGTLTPGLAWMASSDGDATASTGTGIYFLGHVLAAGSTVSGTVATVTFIPIGQSSN